mmetsp:Transcript_8404/g.37140  ORF Transcript_8404/g.37140 Transcript_8404/m.37140 type:complete len:237 (-) Transcript_8404:931-1641(-)
MLGVRDRRAESPDDVRRVRPRGMRAVRVASPARQVRATRRRRRFGKRRGWGGYTRGCGVDVSGVRRARSIRRARRRRRRLDAAIRVGAKDDRGGVQTAVARALPGGEAAERRRGPEKRKVVQEVRRLGSPGVRAAAAWHLSAEAHRGSHRRGSARGLATDPRHRRRRVRRELLRRVRAHAADVGRVEGQGSRRRRVASVRGGSRADREGRRRGDRVGGCVRRGARSTRGDASGRRG